MAKINYEWLGSTRRTTVMDENDAHRTLGRRAMSGWLTVSRFFRDPEGCWVSLTWQCSDDGKIIAVYWESIAS